MNILLINHYAGSPQHGMEFRPFYLAREWVRAGHCVQIIAASFSHLRTMQPTIAGAVLDEKIEGIKYHWYATPVYQGNGVGRVKNMLSFLWALWRDARKLARDFKPDVVIASSTYPMDIWPAQRIAKLAKAKLVFEVHDLWPLSPVELGGMSASHPFIHLCQAAENAAYRDADIVVSMLPNVAEYVQSKGLAPSRLSIVPNGISLDDWQSGQSAPLRVDVQRAIDAAKATGSNVVGYAGSHGRPNALDNLLNAATLLRAEAVQFVMVGDGHERERLAARVQEEGMTNVHMFPPIPKSQIPAFLEQIDAAYLGAPRQPLYRFGVSPNKMIDYMMGGVPILYAIESGNHPVTEADCGLSIPAEDPQSLATAIRSLCETPPERLRRMGENGKCYALAKHTYAVLSETFLQAIRLIPRKT
jgi:glycosyltransferase involved in cell wall biosynthesis